MILSAAGGRACQPIASSSRQVLLFSTSATSSARTLSRPPATKPASQEHTQIPINVYDLTKKYPRHPLLAFFNTDKRKVKETANSSSTEEVQIPVSLRSSDLKDDSNSRGWLAPELRTKSSLDLHQLWYKCLLERNKIHTTLSEIRRVGGMRLLNFNNYNGYKIDRRVKKTMARIKFVLNERRLALLEARRRAATTWQQGIETIEISPVKDSSDSMYEEEKKASI